MANNKHIFYHTLLITGMALACIGMQAKEIQGRVIDNEGKAVQGASVVVMSLPDSVFAGTSVTNEAGEVIIETGEVDSVLVTVQMLGYGRFQTIASSDFTVSLEPVYTQLQEVVVEAKPEFRTEAGKLVFTPGDLVKRVNNAQDILQYVPMVRITGTEISVSGSPRTIVYVNGKPPRGILSDIKNLIKSLPPSCIKRIEVIKEGGASVEGLYNGAIVNIVMTYPWEGFVGVVDVSAHAEPDIITPKGSLSLYYTKEKWSFALFGRYSAIGDDDKNRNYYEYLKDYPNGIQSYINDIHHRKWINIFGTTFSANYNFTEKSTLGVVVGIGWFGSKQKDITTTTYTTVTSEEYEHQSAIRDTVPYSTPQFNANLFYTLQTDDKGSNLDIVLSYYVSQRNTHTGMFYTDSTLFRNQSNYQLGLGGKAEYRHRFSKRVWLKAGAGLIASTVDDALDFYKNSNRFIYDEKLLHVYGELNFPWHRTSFVVGLRIESEFNNGEVRNTGDSFRRNNTAILPSISFDWQMPWHKQSLSASLSQRVMRPWITELNPFRIWTTENTYSEGNPYLKNHYYLIGSLNYMSVSNIIVRTSFSKFFGNKSVITLPDDNGLMGTHYYDSPGAYSISAGVNYSKGLLSFWNVDASVGYSFHHEKYTCEGVLIKRIFNMVSFSAKSIFNFSKRYGIFGSIYYNVSSPFRKANDSRGGWRNYLAVDIRKDWKNCSLSLFASGLIPMRNKDSNFDSELYIARYNKTNYGPGFILNFRYIFGNKQTRGVKTRDAGASSRFE